MDLDVTLIIQLTLFVSIVVILNGMLFKPFLGVIEARHAKIHGTRIEAERLKRLTTEERTAYQHRMSSARGSAQQAREELVRQGRDEERRVLSAARLEVSRAMQETRTRISSESDRVRDSLRKEQSVLAQHLVRKVLGREVTL